MEKKIENEMESVVILGLYTLHNISYHARDPEAPLPDTNSPFCGSGAAV